MMASHVSPTGWRDVVTATSTRDRILATAATLFYRYGIHRVGVEQICQAAKVKKPTLYHHFGSKDGLIAAYLEDQNERVFGALTRVVQRADGRVADRVAAAFEFLAHPPKGWNGCPFLRTVAEFAGQPDHPARHLAAQHKKRFEAWLAGFLAGEAVREPERLARRLSTLLDGAVTHVFLHGDGDYAAEAALAARDLINGHLSPSG